MSTTDLTPQEIDIVENLTNEAFSKRHGHVHKRPIRYRQMSYAELWGALRTALEEQKSAHLRGPKYDQGES